MDVGLPRFFLTVRTSYIFEFFYIVKKAFRFEIINKSFPAQDDESEAIYVTTMHIVKSNSIKYPFVVCLHFTSCVTWHTTVYTFFYIIFVLAKDRRHLTTTSHSLAAVLASIVAPSIYCTSISYTSLNVNC